MTLSIFEAAGGTAAGRAHALSGRNNQDAFHWGARGPFWAGAVCDGSSSGARSEMGAVLGSRLAVEAFLRGMEAGEDPAGPAFRARARDELVAELGRLARGMGEGALAECLLFTVVGAAVGPGGGCLLSIGDGVAAWNGEVLRMGPFPENAPPYLAYALADPALGFEAHRSGPVEHLLVGTDGLADFGRLGEFWTDGRYFRNRDRVRRRLALAAREGTLPDDAALVVARRRAGP